MKFPDAKSERLFRRSKKAVKKVGVFEGLQLKFTGWRDGVRNLPREDDQGHWVSPHLDREVRSYEEFSSQVWGQLQMKKASVYVLMGELADSSARTAAQLQKARSDLEAAMARDEGTTISIRKPGEDRLTEAQVKERRTNERIRKLASVREKVSSLEHKLTGQKEELSALFYRILEENNSTRMVCNYVKEYMMQRVDVYWNSALHAHRDNAKMPAVPVVAFTSQAEELYLKQHSALMEKAESCSLTAQDNRGMGVA